MDIKYCFCGSEPSIERFDYTDKDTDEDVVVYEIMCNNTQCPITIKTTERYNTIEDAVHAWNMRNKQGVINMDIKEIKEEKELLESQIQDLVTSFNKKTGTDIVEIDLGRVVYRQGEDKLSTYNILVGVQI